MDLDRFGEIAEEPRLQAFRGIATHGIGTEGDYGEPVSVARLQHAQRQPGEMLRRTNGVPIREKRNVMNMPLRQPELGSATKAGRRLRSTVWYRGAP